MKDERVIQTQVCSNMLKNKVRFVISDPEIPRIDPETAQSPPPIGNSMVPCVILSLNCTCTFLYVKYVKDMNKMNRKFSIAHITKTT